MFRKDGKNDFAAFILTHGRANNVVTYKTLRERGYTGKIYIVIDNEDEQADEYRTKYGDNVLMFDKLAVSKTFDTMDTQQNRKTIVYARNACFELAKRVGVRFFVELDDDYDNFEFRWREDGKLLTKKVESLDEVFEAYLVFMQESKALTVALAQGGDFIGGAKSTNFEKKILRKAMNSFICDVERPFKFIGRINEDVNTYTTLGNIGERIFTVTDVDLTQKQTQSNKGGMTETYLDAGTYVKSFYTVMAMPSCVKIGTMGQRHIRMHHEIEWRKCVPMIIDAKWKKGAENGERTSQERN